MAQSIGMFTAELNAMLWFGDSPKHISVVLGKLMRESLLDYSWPEVRLQAGFAASAPSLYIYKPL